MRRALDAARLDGAIVIDKPQGLTSFSALRVAQRALGQKTIGHAGTLDPMATGVLVLLIGEATKLSNLVMEHDKVYEATILLGVETDTLDAEGVPTLTRPIPPDAVDPTYVVERLADFIGERPQVPPRYSALKKDGRTHMSRARAGEEFEIEPRPSLCHGLELMRVDGGALTIRVHCGKGYYVRSFARDLGRALGTCAHLVALRRTRVGVFDISRAVVPGEVSPNHLIPLIELLPDVPKLVLDGRLLDDVRCGRMPLLPEGDDSLAGCSTILGITTSREPVALLSATLAPRPILKVQRGFMPPDSGRRPS
jgi:tRNA pseudouridine55 synthase